MLYVIVEYCEYGSLLDFIHQSKCTTTSKSDDHDVSFTEDPEVYNAKDLMMWSSMICSGMCFLEECKVVHGDLALRNVLLADHSGTVKICDFGLSKNIYKYGQYKKRGSSKVPVKWMSPEALGSGLYSSASDVWSYGITLWELWSGGQIPYQGRDMETLIW